MARDGHLDQSEAYDISQFVREYGPCRSYLSLRDIRYVGRIHNTPTPSARLFYVTHRTVLFIIGQGFIVNNYTLNKCGNLKVLCRKIKQVRFRIFLEKELCFIVIYSEYIHTAKLYLLSITI